MSFDFQQYYHKNPSNLRKSKGLQQLINELDGKSDHGQQNNQKKQPSEIDFDRFDEVEKSKSSYSKSFLSELYNKPKQQQQIKQTPKQSLQHRPQQYEMDNNTSRDILEISYLNNLTENQSFQFDRSISYEISHNQENQRFQKLKKLLSKSKQNNLDAFYRNIQQAQNQKVDGNLIFQNKKQFVQFTNQIKQNKKKEEIKFKQTIKIYNFNSKNSKNSKVRLFGEQAVDAFKKKNQTNIENILPPQFSQQQQNQDFFNSNGQGINKIQTQQNYGDFNNHEDFFNSNINRRLQDQSLKQKQNNFYLQGEQFFNINTSDNHNNNAKNSNFQSSKPNQSSNKFPKNIALQPIREQRQTILDHSIEQKKFQQLIKDYNNMKNNYSDLMYQLKQTSQGQFKLMDEMQRIKHSYNKTTQQTLINQQRQLQKKTIQIHHQKQQKHKQKQKTKQITQQKLQLIKNQICEMKNSKNSNDLVYLKINQKIQELQKIVRLALEEVIQEKKQKQQTFIPKVINYFDDNSHRGETNRSKDNNQENQIQHQIVNLSRQSEKLYEVAHVKFDNKESKTKIAKHESNWNLNSKQLSNQNSQINTANRQKDGYNDKHINKEQSNFIDDFSSPLQLDLSTDERNNSAEQHEQSYQGYEMPFNPPQFALQFLPLKIDSSPSKNMRNILTQKSSILYESFEFLITIRYQMQSADETYPILGKVKISNKCAIDLLDVFVIVYGAHGHNIQISPTKVYEERLKYNSNILFELRIDKQCIQDNGFNVQICYKTDSITKKKINFKGLLPIIQMIRPQFSYQQNFINCWQLFQNQIYIKPAKLNLKHIRTHDDLKLILPFIHVSQNDSNVFSYGIMFRYPKSKMLFLLKVICYLNGKASIHLRSDKNGEHKLKQELLNVINFLILT